MGFRANGRHRGKQLKCQSCEGSMSTLWKFPYRDFDHSLFNFVVTLVYTYSINQRSASLRAIL